jgi:predicted ribosome quality control (RQC) complex YloA/Tae2 family protein
MFRKFLTSSGKEVLAGKNAENNEELVAQVGKDETVLHTASPGSPFVNIKARKEYVTDQDLRESAIFCARYSGKWKKAKKKPKSVEVHYFLGKDIFKLESMKTGTFGVKRNKKIVVKSEEIEKIA